MAIVFKERIAPGDAIPLHRHTVAEVLFVDEGQIEARVGEDRRVVEPNAVVFIPAGTAHGFRNVGDGVARSTVSSRSAGADGLGEGDRPLSTG